MAPERSDARVSGMAHCNRWWHVHGAQPNVRHINLASAVRLETPLPQRHPHPSRHEGPLPKHSHRPEHRGIAIKPPPSRRGQKAAPAALPPPCAAPQAADALPRTPHRAGVDHGSLWVVAPSYSAGQETIRPGDVHNVKPGAAASSAALAASEPTTTFSLNPSCVPSG